MPLKKPPNRCALSDYDYAALACRLQYLCEFSFGGDCDQMAVALRQRKRDVEFLLSGRVRPTPRTLAHVAAALNVRPEWLLTGAGSVYRILPEIDGFQLPLQLKSSFTAFDPCTSSASAYLPLPPPKKAAKRNQPHIASYRQAGRAMYQARRDHKLIGFFLGRDYFAAGAALRTVSFYSAGFADVLCLTLPAVCHDLGSVCTVATLDLNVLAKFAATRGVGYGEAIGLNASAALCTRETSVMLSVYDLGLPVVVSAELGELAAHTAPGLGGAETGAAIGAAAYVDLLVLTEQLKTFFGSPGGVFVFAGEHVRGVRLVLERIESLRIDVPQPAGFTFVLFAPVDPELKSLIHHHGGRVIFLGHPTTAAMLQLFQTCTDAYAGKI